jgi:hypothetical protein
MTNSIIDGTLHPERKTTGKAEAPFSAGKGIALHCWYCQGQAALRFR